MELYFSNSNFLKDYTMTALRTKANLKIATKTRKIDASTEKIDIAKIFGEYVFNETKMREALPKETFRNLQQILRGEKAFSREVAEVVAVSVKNWALSHGATHYTHWFHPLTGSTAEKHDSFLAPLGNGSIIQQFSANSLIQGEPDASSFPSGGLRTTFEARGYTAWDVTSPMFLRKNKHGVTLIIPTAFCSFTGEALDKKTPLLRSQHTIADAGKRLLKLLNKETSSIRTFIGIEQEYFLVDKALYCLRPDLIASGRTLFGAPPFKGQALDDHYFGSIQSRVINYMQDVEKELYRLGIPISTRHNEVAPGQYEVAPVYEEANVAIDHNQIIMEVMSQFADKHHFAFLTHEKPFAGLNGSGKHCNWSLATEEKENLLDPGKTPHDNLQFMLFLTAIISGLDKHADLLRLAIANAGNDHRLGANEAPPAIISIFLGNELQTIIDNIVQGNSHNPESSSSIHLGTSLLPELPKDLSDRNRTSPFAFTGNKFEFRALGSSQHVATPVTYLNTIVADSINYIADKLEAALQQNTPLKEASTKVIKELLTKHARILFSGDNYTQEWKQEATKRGLPNLENTPEAASALLRQENIDLLQKTGVLTTKEIQARFHIKLEKYISTLDIELNASADIVRTQILPCSLKYEAVIDKHAKISGDSSLLDEISKAIKDCTQELYKFEKAYATVPEDLQEHAEYYAQKLVPMQASLRATADKLETLVDDSLWVLPKYRELIHTS